MSYNSVGPGALRAAVVTVLDTCTRSGVVCSDPRFAEDPSEYVPHVTSGGIIHGVVVESGSERDPTPNEEFSLVLVTLFLQFNETRASDGLSSIDYFDAMIAELKEAFKAAPRLGFTTPYNVKQDGLYAPDGYSREQGVLLYHFGPMQILVKQRVC